METINGFSIIAEKPTADGKARIILGAMRHGGTREKRHEYVVARAPQEPTTHWDNGTYVSSIAQAVRFFEERV